MARTFSEILMEAKRRAQLSGRPLSRQEASGIAEGYSNAATDRLTRAKQLSIQQQGIDTSASQFDRSLAFQKEQNEANREAEEKAGMVGSAVNLATTAGTLYALKSGMLGGAKTAVTTGAAGTSTAGAGGTLAPASTTAPGVASGIATGVGKAVPYYAAARAGGEIITNNFDEDTGMGKFGKSLQQPLNVEQHWLNEAGIGSDKTQAVLDVLNPLGLIERSIGGSWLCTETHKNIRLEKDHIQTLKRFKQYVHDEHRGVLKFYLTIGPQLIKAIAEAEGRFNIKEFYNDLKQNMIQKVIVFTDSCHLEQAYNLYMQTTKDLIKKYLPEASNEADAVLKVDAGLKQEG